MPLLFLSGSEFSCLGKSIGAGCLPSTAVSSGLFRYFITKQPKVRRIWQLLNGCNPTAAAIFLYIAVSVTTQVSINLLCHPTKWLLIHMWAYGINHSVEAAAAWLPLPRTILSGVRADRAGQAGRGEVGRAGRGGDSDLFHAWMRRFRAPSPADNCNTAWRTGAPYRRQRHVSTAPVWTCQVEGRRAGEGGGEAANVAQEAANPSTLPVTLWSHFLSVLLVGEAHYNEFPVVMSSISFQSSDD